MLSDLLDESLVQLNVEASDWEDAIRKATAPLVANGKVTEGYVDDIIKGVHELGPYIVITEHVALPHARPESGALESAVGIVTLKDPVEFGSEDNDSHLSALQSLVELLSDPDVFTKLDACKDAKEVVDLVHVKERGM